MVTKKSGQATRAHTYSTYLQIDKLLSAQKTDTGSDNELLFIIIHQSHELWFKLAIHELDCAIRVLEPADPGGANCAAAHKRLARVSQILELQIASWSVLRTLTPDEFEGFRATVGRNGASGFQSIQYRVLEFKLGLKYQELAFERIEAGKTIVSRRSIFENVGPKDSDTLKAALSGKSLYDAVVGYLSKNMIASQVKVPAGADRSKRYVKQKAVFEVWKSIYQNRESAPELYQLGERLVDVEDAFRRWRINHLSTVSRIIGSNTGTGGSSGLRYLKGVADQLFEKPMFPELWDVRNFMFDQDKFNPAEAGYTE
jgi:tryptophan 2,3-dioxygenase